MSPAPRAVASWTGDHSIAPSFSSLTARAAAPRTPPPVPTMRVRGPPAASLRARVAALRSAPASSAARQTWAGLVPGAMPCSDSGPPSPNPSTRSDRSSGPSSAAAAPSASRSAWPLTPSSCSTDASDTLSSLPLSSAQRSGSTCQPTVTPLPTASAICSRSSDCRTLRTNTSAVPDECRTSPSPVAPAPTVAVT